LARERFHENARLAQMMTLMMHLDKHQRAGMEAFVAMKEALVATEEEEARAAEAVRVALRKEAEAEAAWALEAAPCPTDEVVADVQAIAMLQDNSVDVATIELIVRPFLRPYTPVPTSSSWPMRRQW
jgi:hypothetical protein